MGVQISSWDHGFTSFGYTPRSCNATSYDNSSFTFLRNSHTGFQCGCIILHSRQECTNVLNSPQHHQPLLAIFLIAVILMGVRLYLIVVLIYISLVICDVEHIFMCSLPICISSLEKCLFKSFANFLLFSYSCSLCIVDINSLSGEWFANVFSCSIGSLCFSLWQNVKFYLTSIVLHE